MLKNVENLVLAKTKKMCLSLPECSKWGGGGGRFSIDERGVVELLPSGALLPAEAGLRPPTMPGVGICSFDMTDELRRAGGGGFIELCWARLRVATLFGWDPVIKKNLIYDKETYLIYN